MLLFVYHTLIYLLLLYILPLLEMLYIMKFPHNKTNFKVLGKPLMESYISSSKNLWVLFMFLHRFYLALLDLDCLIGHASPQIVY